jgi:hypothetical protein
MGPFLLACCFAGLPQAGANREATDRQGAPLESSSNNRQLRATAVLPDQLPQGIKPQWHNV